MPLPSFSVPPGISALDHISSSFPGSSRVIRLDGSPQAHPSEIRLRNDTAKATLGASASDMPLIG